MKHVRGTISYKTEMCLRIMVEKTIDKTFPSSSVAAGKGLQNLLYNVNLKDRSKNTRSEFT